MWHSYPWGFYFTNSYPWVFILPVDWLPLAEYRFFERKVCKAVYENGTWKLHSHFILWWSVDSTKHLQALRLIFQENSSQLNAAASYVSWRFKCIFGMLLVSNWITTHRKNLRLLHWAKNDVLSTRFQH